MQIQGLRKLVLACISVVFTAVSSAAIAGETRATAVLDKDIDLLNALRNNAFVVKTSDQVSDGCWLIPTDAARAVSVEFLRSGIKVLPDTSDNALVPVYKVAAIGFGTTQTSCAIYVEAKLIMVRGQSIAQGDQELASLGLEQRTVGGTLLAGPKAQMTERIKAASVSLAQGFIVDFTQHRDALLDDLRKKQTPGGDYWFKYFNRSP
ncbi:MAG: hypothetical protein RLO06_09045 [Parvibaculum sp.]